MDFNSEGVMLLTNDGKLGEKVFKSRKITKTYLVKVKGHPTSAELDFLETGIFTGEGVVRFKSYSVDQELKSKSWLKLEVTEGSNLNLIEILNRKGLRVDRIIRSAIGHIDLSGLDEGEFRYLKKSDFERLLKSEGDQKLN
jgi:pseudouridine synthase